VVWRAEELEVWTGAEVAPRVDVGKEVVLEVGKEVVLEVVVTADWGLFLCL